MCGFTQCRFFCPCPHGTNCINAATLTEFLRFHKGRYHHMISYPIIADSGVLCEERRKAQGPNAKPSKECPYRL
ncbi:hypothetical protein PT974_09939 [Cladobotryum mycophilum]|uniref:Uncharacterized protein n=1 Tax=Cladobotryum mycophilum TaxID=491253 RepID=A0ABR0S9E4_9HYPO